MELSLDVGIMFVTLESIRVNLLMETFMAMELSRTLIIESTMENGRMGLSKGMEFSSGLMAIAIKDSI